MTLSDTSITINNIPNHRGRGTKDNPLRAPIQ